jgi:hypothetical protein
MLVMLLLLVMLPLLVLLMFPLQPLQLMQLVLASVIYDVEVFDGSLEASQSHQLPP